MPEPMTVALDALYLALRLALPALALAFAIGLLMALLQLVTQLRDAVLTTVPRLVGVGLLVAFSATTLARDLVSFAARVYHALPELMRAL